MRVLKTLAVATAILGIGASAAMACPMDVTADSGQIVIATGPKPVTPQTPIPLLPPAD